MASLADPTVDFMSQFDDESKWLIKRRIPLFKPHERIKTDANGKKSVAYVVTDDDMPIIAGNMQKNQSNGVPARITVGHVNPNHDTPEAAQPQAVGYWLNADSGTFGPNKEPCVFADSYVKRDCAAEVKGRPYRSAEYYPATKEIRGAALLTRDPQLDLGTVEIYKGAYFYSAPGEFYMADDVKGLPDVGDKRINSDPEGHDGWKAHMEHYSKQTPWVSHAMQNYQSSAASATNANIPGEAKPAAKEKEMEVERMNRDDEAVNYARLANEVADLKKARESDMATIATLTAERDREQCERMVRTLQVQTYQLQESTAELVEILLPLSPEGREREILRIKKYAPKGAPIGGMIETYQGNGFEGGEKAKTAATSLDAEQAAKAARYANLEPANSNKRFEKARSALLAGQPLED